MLQAPWPGVRRSAGDGGLQGLLADMQNRGKREADHRMPPRPRLAPTRDLRESAPQPSAIRNNKRRWDVDITDGPSVELGRTRREYPSVRSQEEATARTRAGLHMPASQHELDQRRADLTGDADSSLTWEKSAQSDTGASTGLNWWREFSRYVGLSSPRLSWDEGSREARAQVSNVGLMFCQFTFRLIRPKRGAAPDPKTSLRYLSVVVTAHSEAGVDMKFVLPTARKWAAGMTRATCAIHGPRLKAKKSAFTIQMLVEVYTCNWKGHGGEVNPIRRELVLRTVAKFAIQTLFRASEVLRPRGVPFNHNLHITRGMIEWFDSEWQPVPPTPDNLSRMLETRQGRVLVGIPQLKNDQNRDKFNHCKVALMFSPSFTCSLAELARMEIDDPITDPLTRARTPLFVDPETGAAMGKETFASVFMSLIRQALRTYHNREYLLKEIRRIWSLHSFRITGLNLLEKAGCPPWLLRIAGRWLSDCHYQYTRHDHNLLAKATASMDQQPTGTTPLAEFPTFPFPVKHIPETLPQHPSTRVVTQPGRIQVEPGLAVEAPTDVWNSRNAFNTSVAETLNVPEAVVGRRVRRRFRGSGWCVGTIVSTSVGTGPDETGTEQIFANVRYDDGDSEQLDLLETEAHIIYE